MKLCLDQGNTRLKWGLLAADGWQSRGAFTDGAPPVEWAQAASEVDAIWRVNVAGPVAAARLDRLLGEALGESLPPLFTVRAGAAACGVHNGYRMPQRLGADRWCALIGAHARQPGDCLVVMAGTATTVDSLRANGQFCGGLILPGLALMRRSLARDTAALPLATGCHRDFPQSTEDAIVSGCLEAQAGAIERAWRRLENPQAPCLLSGGAADALAGIIDLPCQRIDNLVLDGLACLAQAPAAARGDCVLSHAPPLFRP